MVDRRVKWDFIFDDLMCLDILFKNEFVYRWVFSLDMGKGNGFGDIVNLLNVDENIIDRLM